mmetsp:Transcript_98257/g.169275  ORF Transcript_98257/g.169275 Transcript_98257/m.169275 type:complete len:262 (+) Transcript_98257:1052-1837(+)
MPASVLRAGAIGPPPVVPDPCRVGLTACELESVLFVLHGPLVCPSEDTLPFGGGVVPGNQGPLLHLWEPGSHILENVNSDMPCIHVDDVDGLVLELRSTAPALAFDRLDNVLQAIVHHVLIKCSLLLSTALREPIHTIYPGLSVADSLESSTPDHCRCAKEGAQFDYLSSRREFEGDGPIVIESPRVHSDFAKIGTQAHLLFNKDLVPKLLPDGIELWIVQVLLRHRRMVQLREYIILIPSYVHTLLPRCYRWYGVSNLCG